jgi:hypothetical protein
VVGGLLVAALGGGGFQGEQTAALQGAGPLGLRGSQQRGVLPAQVREFCALGAQLGL